LRGVARRTNTTKKANDNRRGRPLGGGGRRDRIGGEMQSAVEKMLHKAGWPRGPGRVLLDEIFGLVDRGERYPSMDRLAREAKQFGFDTDEVHKVFNLLWAGKNREITTQEFEESLCAALSSFRAYVDGIEAEDVASRRDGNEDEIAVADLGWADCTNEELNQFHLRREAEQDRKRVCPPLPSDELRRVLGELRKQDWTERDRWVRVESLRRWLGLSPEAIRQAARSGRWAKDIAPESPDARRLGQGVAVLRKIMRLVQKGDRDLPSEVVEEGAAVGVDAAAVFLLTWRRRDGEITEASYEKSLGRLLVMDAASKRRAVRFCCWAAWVWSSLWAVLIKIMRLVQDGDRNLPSELVEEGAAAGVDAAAVLRLLWQRKDAEITEESYAQSLGGLLAVFPEEARERAVRLSCGILAVVGADAELRGRGRCGKPNDLLGPRATAKVLRAYATTGGELGPEAVTTAAALERVKWRKDETSV